MRNKKFSSAFQYCFRDIVNVLASTCGIYALVCIGIWILDLIFPENVNVNIDGGGGIAMSYVVTIVITLFVVGIVGVREYLRTLVLHGRSRKTAMLAYFLAVAAAAGCAMALFFLINLGESLVTGQYFDSLVLAALLIMLVMLNATLWGSAISLLFWRLPKRWKTVAAVGIPVSLLYLFPTLFSFSWFEPFMNWAFSGLGPMIVLHTLALFAAGAIDCLLARRAAILASK